MKVLYRIWYALTAGVLLAFTVLKSVEWRNITYNNKYGAQALMQESAEDKYLFFYETVGIHGKEPLKVISNDNFEVSLYEINLFDFNEKNENIYFIKTYLYPLINIKNKDILTDKQTLVLSFTTNAAEEDRVAPYQIYQYLSLDLYVVNTIEGSLLIPLITNSHLEEDSEYIEKDLLNRGVNNITIFDADVYVQSGVSLLDKSLFITLEDLVVRNKLKQQIINKQNNNEELSFSREEKDLLAEEEIYFQVIHNPSEFNYLIYIPLAIYFVVLIISAYFVFFYKRKNPNLGKVEPAKGFHEYRSKEYEKK